MNFFKKLRELEKDGWLSLEINGVDKSKIDFAAEKLDRAQRTLRVIYINNHEIIDSVPKKYKK